MLVFTCIARRGVPAQAAWDADGLRVALAAPAPDPETPSHLRRPLYALVAAAPGALRGAGGLPLVRVGKVPEKPKPLEPERPSPTTVVAVGVSPWGAGAVRAEAHLAAAQRAGAGAAILNLAGWWLASLSHFSLD